MLVDGDDQGDDDERTIIGIDQATFGIALGCFGVLLLGAFGTWWWLKSKSSHQVSSGESSYGNSNDDDGAAEMTKVPSSTISEKKFAPGEGSKF
jgi:hypothetical protein